jgi:phage repressor protein C with HTH and peptisase S24 domain
MNSELFSDRINILIEAHESAAKLSRLVGVSESVVRKWRNGNSDPSRENLVALAKSTRTNLVWLATGEGLMNESSQPIAVSPGESVEVVVLDIEVSAGHGAQNSEEPAAGTMSFRKKYLQQRGLQSDKLRIIFAKGDSMEPDIQDGAPLLVNTSDQRLDDGCIYIVRLNDHLFAKRIQRVFDGSIRLISANTSYPPMDVPASSLPDLHVVGRVVWSGREY